MMSSPLIATIPAPPSVVPLWADPSLYTWMMVGTVTSMAASVAANCWSLDIDLETSVIAVGAGGGRLQCWSGLCRDWSPGWCASRPKIDRAAWTVVRQSGRLSRSLTLSFRTTRRGSSTLRLFYLIAWRHSACLTDARTWKGQFHTGQPLLVWSGRDGWSPWQLEVDFFQAFRCWRTRARVPRPRLYNQRRCVA